MVQKLYLGVKFLGNCATGPSGGIALALRTWALDMMSKGKREEEIEEIVMVFRDRKDAGRRLSEKLRHHAGDPNLVVLALPRGGVPVAFEVASALQAPLDVFLVRKIGVPGQEELAMGAVATGGVRVLNQGIVQALDIPAEALDAMTEQARLELTQRERLYRDDRPPPEVKGRTVILVDDGLATGSSMRAAVAAMRQQHPARIIVAVPVASASTCEELQDEVEEVVCLLTPEPFHAVGLWYEDFSQTTDEEIRELLDRNAKHPIPVGQMTCTK
jgi:predicted phosphoribosyltransferase